MHRILAIFLLLAVMPLAGCGMGDTFVDQHEELVTAQSDAITKLERLVDAAFEDIRTKDETLMWNVFDAELAKLEASGELSAESVTRLRDQLWDAIKGLRTNRDNARNEFDMVLAEMRRVMRAERKAQEVLVEENEKFDGLFGLFEDSEEGDE